MIAVEVAGVWRAFVVLTLGAPGCFASYIGEATSAQRALQAPDREHVALAAVTASAHRPVYLRADLIAITTPEQRRLVWLRGYNRMLTAGVILLGGSAVWPGLGVGIGFALAAGQNRDAGLGAFVLGVGLGMGMFFVHFIIGSIVTLVGALRPSQEARGGQGVRVYIDAPAGALRF